MRWRLSGPCLPTGPCGELSVRLVSDVLKFEAMAAKAAVRRALVISQVSGPSRARELRSRGGGGGPCWLHDRENYSLVVVSASNSMSTGWWGND